MSRAGRLLGNPGRYRGGIAGIRDVQAPLRGEAHTKTPAGQPEFWRTLPATTEADARAKMLIYLIQNGMLKAESPAL